MRPGRQDSGIAAIYQDSWKIKLFCKLIKYYLKVKIFPDTSKNAVLTQVWIALYVFLRVAYLNFKYDEAILCSRDSECFNSICLNKVIFTSTVICDNRYKPRSCGVGVLPLNAVPGQHQQKNGWCLPPAFL